MTLRLKQKNIDRLLPTDILFQTRYWARVKARLGWKPHAFDIVPCQSDQDLLILSRSIGPDTATAYVPQGPEFSPDPEDYGTYLESLSESIAAQMGREVAFIRYDLPWESPYAADVAHQGDRGFPEARIRELRMNFSTRNWNLKKAPVDMTVADTYVVDIDCDEDTLLSRMKAKTRYNIRLAQRKGVRVTAVSASRLPLFYRLYRETARRNGFFASDYRYFEALFAPHEHSPASSEIVLLLATHGEDLLAGAIITITEKGAFFLHGGSSARKRDHMGSYALQWEAIRQARTRQCRTYDMGAVSPGKIPDHAFFGLYRFKSGFGGRIVHRCGSWDYPLKEEVYTQFRNWENLQGGYEIGCRLIPDR
ncbi:MAG: peptidoglycan bridge formation glycyltransferase FemA/FemB family protein [Desulfobacteraceae bacterium]|nr:peptidoglycan bridge formation glycyltransferase FemA/FemB family protein [Desulfobacteraceae bacterium]